MMDLDIDFLKIENTVKPKQGSLLISEPFSQDSYFKRSVVLLTEHNEEGTLGFILNKPVKASLKEVLEGFPSFNASVSLGGPVGTDSIYYLHTLGDKIPESVKVKNNIYWGGNFDILQIMIASGAIGSDQIRFFIGYSGWRPNQLKGEIEKNYWIVSNRIPKEIELMTNNSEDVWNTAVNSLGNRYKIWNNIPENPVFN